MNEYYFDEAMKNFIYIISKGNNLPIDAKDITISIDLQLRLRSAAALYIMENQDQ